MADRQALRWGGVARLLVAVIVAVMVAVSCGDDADTQVSGPSSTADGESGSDAEDSTGQPLDLSGGLDGAAGPSVALETFQAGPLEAGTYIPARFGLPVAVTLPEGWHLRGQIAQQFELTPVQVPLTSDPSESIWLVDLSDAALLDPPYPPNVIEQLGTEYQRWPVTDDVTERLAESSWLEAGPIESVSIDGIEVSAFDYRVLDLDEALFTDEEGYVSAYAFDLPGEWFHPSHGGEVGRFWIVPLDADDVLLIDAYVAAEGDAVDFLAIAGAVVESMRFG